MTKAPLEHSYVDHFLQAEIISKLAAAEQPIRFSELKDDGIENSLFMYHANKLITRGLIQKSDAGFSLTTKGARWANYAGVLHGFTVTTPRPLLQFVIQDSDGRVMLAMRKGQLRQLLNDYLLPGNIYQYGTPLADNVMLILKDMFGDITLPTAKQLTTADIIHEFADGFVHHVISYIFALDLTGTAPQDILSNALFNIAWVPLKELTVTNPQFKKSLFLPTFFERLADLKPHETFVIQSK